MILRLGCNWYRGFQKNLDQGQAGDNAGLLLRGIEREQIERGQVVVKPGSLTPHTEFSAEVYILKKEEGGRHSILKGLQSHSSTSVQLTLPVKLSYQLTKKWLCLVTLLPSTLSYLPQLLWSRV